MRVTTMKREVAEKALAGPLEVRRPFDTQYRGRLAIAVDGSLVGVVELTGVVSEGLGYTWLLGRPHRLEGSWPYTSFAGIRALPPQMVAAIEHALVEASK